VSGNLTSENVKRDAEKAAQAIRDGQLRCETLAGRVLALTAEFEAVQRHLASLEAQRDELGAQYNVESAVLLQLAAEALTLEQALRLEASR
jgi:hypothetical protein